MSTQSPEQKPGAKDVPSVPDTMQFTDEERALAREVQSKNNPNRPLWVRLGVGVAGLAAVGAAAVGIKSVVDGGGDPQDKRAEHSTSKVVDGSNETGPIAFSEENNDRNGDGSFDNFTDVNNNGVTDSDELYDPATGEFIDPNEGSDEAALENATKKELSQIAEIESAFPTIGDVEPHWKSTFLAADELVQRFTVEQASRSGDFETTDDWQAAVLYAMTLTPEEIKDAAANAE